MTETPKTRNEIFSSITKPSVEQMEKDLGFQIPVDTVRLPSKGLVYPLGSALHMKETVDIRSLTVKDEDILNSQAYAKKGITISKLLESCITETGIDVKEMILADRTAIMVSLRIVSYGADYNGEVICDECGFKEENFEFNLGQLPLKFLEVQPDKIGTNEFTIELPVSKAKATLKFLTGREEEEILMMMDKNKKNKIADTALVSTRLKYSIVSINGETDKLKLDKFIRNMMSRDNANIQKFYKEYEPGLEMTVQFNCPDCESEVKIPLPMNASFFRPY